MSNSIEHKNFILGTKLQQHDIHLIIKVIVTLIDNEKGHKNELMVIFHKLIHSQTSYLVPRYNTISDI